VCFLIEDPVEVLGLLLGQLSYGTFFVQELHYFHQELLSVAHNGLDSAVAQVLFQLGPVLAEELQAFKEAAMFFFGPPTSPDLLASCCLFFL